jgi:hypothetical protein
MAVEMFLVNSKILSSPVTRKTLCLPDNPFETVR